MTTIKLTKVTINLIEIEDNLTKFEIRNTNNRVIDHFLTLSKDVDYKISLIKKQYETN